MNKIKRYHVGRCDIVKVEVEQRKGALECVWRLVQAMVNTITVEAGDTEDYRKLSCHPWPR